MPEENLKDVLFRTDGMIYRVLEPNPRIIGDWWTEAVDPKENTGRWSHKPGYIKDNKLESSEDK